MVPGKVTCVGKRALSSADFGCSLRVVFRDGALEDVADAVGVDVES